jgi:uncharacterized protein (DUF736 family)
MSLQLNPNSGLAFRNIRGLERSDKAPHFKGELLYKGERIEIAIWERQTKSGQTMLSMNLDDAVAAEIERVERRLNDLRNRSEGEEPERDNTMVKVDESQDDHIKRTSTKSKAA